MKKARKLSNDEVHNARFLQEGIFFFALNKKVGNQIKLSTLLSYQF